jgi:phage shock protein C
MQMDDRLYRSTTDRLFTGLCGGLADHFDVAPGLVRLLWVILDVFTGVFPLLLVYIVMAMLVPEEPPVGTPGPGSSWNAPLWGPGAPSGTDKPGAASEGGAPGLEPEGAQAAAPGLNSPASAGAPDVGTGSQEAAPGVAGPAQPSGSWGAWGPPPPSGSDWRTVRAYARAQRRAQRAYWRSQRWSGLPSTVALILGVLLVLVGGAALLGQAVPTFNTDVVWPLALIVVGALLLAGAFRR